MTLPPLPLIGGALFIDNSHWMEPLATCTRLLEYQSLHQRISSAEKSALNFGTAQHLIREYRYKVYQNRPLDQEYFENVATLLADFYTEHPCPEEDWRNLNWAVEVSKQYDQRYAQEGFKLLEYDKPIDCAHCNGHGQVPDQPVKTDSSWTASIKPCLFCSGTGKNSMMVEMSFTIPLFTWKGWLPWEALPEDFPPSQIILKEMRNGSVWWLVHIHVVYSGRIDLPVVLDGDIWVRDTKTTSILGEMFWTKMKMSAQQKGYCWAFKELTGKPVKGFIVDAIRTKEPPQYVRDGKPRAGSKATTPEAWWNESLQRERFHLTDDQTNEWKDNAIELVEKFFWHYSRGYMPMETSWCSQYGRCQYYSVCELAREDRGIMLSSGLFADNKWTPLKQVNKETK